VLIFSHTADTEAQQAGGGGQQAREAVSMATGREWKSEKWWIALHVPLATRTIDRYPLGPRGQGVGTSPGAVHTRAWAGVRGGNRPPRRQAHPGAPSLPRGAPKGRHNRHCFSLQLERAKWAENLFRLAMDGILNTVCMGHGPRSSLAVRPAYRRPTRS
jgi:hypothetical protein